MAKCGDCGSDMGPDDMCPKCGIAGGPQTITDLPGADVKGARRVLMGEISGEKRREEKLKEATCRSCGEKVYPDIDVCPHCGEAGGIETITDLPPVNLRQAHRKLKEEIREAREERKREGK